MTTFLNPAPSLPLSADLLTLPDLTPNETEASVLSGVTVTDLGPPTSRSTSSGQGCQTVIIYALGAQGSVLVRRGEVRHFPRFQ